MFLSKQLWVSSNRETSMFIQAKSSGSRADFRVKTLEELRAEKRLAASSTISDASSSSISKQDHTHTRGCVSTSEREEEKEGVAGGVKKVLLIRRKISSTSTSPSMIDTQSSPALSSTGGVKRKQHQEAESLPVAKKPRVVNGEGRVFSPKGQGRKMKIRANQHSVVTSSPRSVQQRSQRKGGGVSLGMEEIVSLTPTTGEGQRKLSIAEIKTEM